MQFKVPQFIEIEDRIFGPLTFRQFVYLVGGAGLSYIIYSLGIPFFFRAILIAPILTLSGLLAFYKINNKPLVFTLEAAFRYFFNRRLYLWQKETQAPTAKGGTPKAKEEMGAYVPKLSGSKLKELSWGLDVIDSSRRG